MFKLLTIYNSTTAHKDQTEFPAAEQYLRDARDRCAKACDDYNNQIDLNDHVKRSALYNTIISPKIRISSPACEQSNDQHNVVSSTNSRKQSDEDKAVEYAVVPGSPPISPMSLMTIPVVGSIPGAAADPSTDADSCHSTASTSVSVSPAPSASFTTPRRFPGQGLAPFIKPPLYMDYGIKVDIGTSTFINRGCKILDTPVRSIKIGERCLIGPDLSIYAVSHPLDYRLRQGPKGAPSYGLDVTIGNDCWIGGHVTILGGVTIGDGCMIGANSLVTKDIPARHLAYGSPARVIRRVDDEGRESVLARITQSFTKLLPIWWTQSSSRRVMTSLSTLALGASVCTAAATFAIQRYCYSTAAG